jgi:SagB-type dehydrogenase family enzyme
MIVLRYRRISMLAFSLFIAAGFPLWARADIKLPKPSFTGVMSVEAAMVAKKSVRNFGATPLTLSQISQLLWSANGNLAYDAVSGATTKVVPSAGGLYPLEIFLLSGKDTVTGLPTGVHQYKPATNSLETISSGDSRASLGQAALGQMWLARAPAIIVIAAAFGRTTSKYGDRGVQYVFMEAGNSNQNLYLQAAALGLRAGTVGAFQDAAVAEAIKLPKGISPLLIIAVGS